MHIRWLVPILAACSLFTGCTKEYSDADLVFVTPDEGRALMAKQEATLFSDPVENIWVDPRRSEFYIAGHIPGAVSMPFKTIATDWTNLEGYGVVVVYGQTYNDPLAEAMSKTLMEYGIKEVRTLRGGIDAWTRAGFELQKGRKP